MDQYIESLSTILLAIFNAGMIVRIIFLFIKGMDDDDLNIKKIMKKYFWIIIIGNLSVLLIDYIKSYFS